MLHKRASGIILHPTSLPGPFGIGDLGEEAYNFINFLGDNFQQVWQVLPLGPTGYGHSPYLCYSAFAGNHWLISLEKLKEKGLLEGEDLQNLPEFPEERVDYDLVFNTKAPLLRKASEKFQNHGSDEDKQAFEKFCALHSYWLEDYSLFMAIKEDQGGASWNKWDKEIASREPEALNFHKKRLADTVFHHKFLQFIFFRQWKYVKEYANSRGITILGDLPIYVAHDSAEVWSHPEIFCLDQKTFEPSTMAGVPPDYFSASGQLWGNPVYLWKRLKKNNYKWWVQRIKGMLEYVDVIRIDHFRAFEAFWGVKPGEETAIKGKWLKTPGEDFFEVLGKELGEIPVVAEDLGVITPEVEALRDKFNFPGMKVLHFAFDSDRGNPFLPYNYHNRNCIVYTGTHDNNTTVGWFEERSPEEKARVSDYLGCIVPEGIHWSLIRLALSSVANTAIFPLQDIFGLSSWARMNTPSTVKDNWAWRFRAEDLTPDLGDRLKYYTWLYGRAPY